MNNEKTILSVSRTKADLACCECQCCACIDGDCDECGDFNPLCTDAACGCAGSKLSDEERLVVQRELLLSDLMKRHASGPVN